VGDFLWKKPMGDGHASDAVIPVYNPTKDPTHNRKNTNDNFPSQYYSIRTTQANTFTITPLGGIGTPVWVLGWGTSGFEEEGGTRHYSVQNYHVTGKKRKR
jgi:hypothetical protein